MLRARYPFVPRRMIKLAGRPAKHDILTRANLAHGVYTNLASTSNFQSFFALKLMIESMPDLV